MRNADLSCAFDGPPAIAMPLAFFARCDPSHLTALWSTLKLAFHKSKVKLQVVREQRLLTHNQSAPCRAFLICRLVLAPSHWSSIALISACSTIFSQYLNWSSSLSPRALPAATA